MKQKHIIGSVFFIAFMTITNTASACGGEESGKHIGNVSKITKSSFTIHDMESNKPITFSADNSLLNKLKLTNSQVLVKYEKNEAGELHAVSISR